MWTTVDPIPTLALALKGGKLVGPETVVVFVVSLKTQWVVAAAHTSIAQQYCSLPFKGRVGVGMGSLC